MEKNNGLIIYGRNAAREALKAKRVTLVYLNDAFNDTSILKLIEDNNVTFKRIHTNELDKMCDGVHQGIACQIKPYEYHSLEELISRGKRSSLKPLIVVLDGINDPHNMGAIMRSCDVFGVDGIIISKHNQVPLNSTVAKTSAGAINYVPVCLVSNLNQALETLKKAGYWVVSTDGLGTKNYSELVYDFPTVLVIGSEGSGVSKLIIKNSDFVIKIPQFGHVNSLNASVAAGIVLAKIRS